MRPFRVMLLVSIGMMLAACSVDHSPEPETPRTLRSTSQPQHVVHLEGPRTRMYSAPTLEAFVEQPGVANVVVGTVRSTRAQVTQPGSTVETILTVDVESQRDPDGPRRVDVREQGGVVRVADVRSDFEDKLRRDLTAEELQELVDFRFDGTAHAVKGDRVLVVLAVDKSGGSDDQFVGLARMTAAEDSSEFTWPGESPNPAWGESIDAARLLG